MAAHIVTALNQLTEDIDLNRINWDHLRAALHFSTWTEDLGLRDYSTLVDIVEDKKIDRLSKWIELVFPVYLKEWQSYGEPRDREGWREAKWGS